MFFQLAQVGMDFNQIKYSSRIIFDSPGSCTNFFPATAPAFLHSNIFKTNKIYHKSWGLFLLPIFIIKIPTTVNWKVLNCYTL
jgi:hypothetical protein